MSNRIRLAVFALAMTPAILFAQEKQGAGKKADKPAAAAAAAPAAAKDSTKTKKAAGKKHSGKKGAKAKADSTKK